MIPKLVLNIHSKAKEHTKEDILQEKVDDFLAENADKITVKDIKYSVQSPNPHQILNLNVKCWTVMVIYDTK